MQELKRITMMQYKDINSTILKIGDHVKNKKGDIYHLQNLSGVSMAIRKNAKGQIVESTVLRKMKFEGMVKV